jgi:hypothetical protein
LFRH